MSKTDHREHPHWSSEDEETIQSVRDVIIAGVTRAGTTSLFSYLSDHPDICPASLKETRFFLDREYPLPRLHYYDEGFEKHEKFFANCARAQVRLAAEPDYLYSPGTAERIRDSLPAVRLVFILREPISRLVSWYRFARQNRFLTPDVSFDEYVNRQLHCSETSQPSPQHLRALEQGFYSQYLQHWLQVFDRDQIRVVQLETLQQAPRSLMQEICCFIGVEPSFYDNYQFQLHNPSIELRNTTVNRLYHELTRKLRGRLHSRPVLRRTLRSIRHTFHPLYLRLNLRPGRGAEISPQMRALLERFYIDEPQALANLLGLSSWSWRSSLERIDEEAKTLPCVPSK